MKTGQIPDVLTLSGDKLSRARQALEFARSQARMAEDSYGPHVEQALIEIQDAISDHVARIRNAVADDLADAEANGDADRERRAWYPSYQAA
jgi:hypothetical protein